MVLRTYINGSKVATEEQNVRKRFTQSRRNAGIDVYEMLLEDSQVSYLKLQPKPEGTLLDRVTLAAMSDAQVDEISSLRMEFHRCKIKEGVLDR